MRPEWNCVVDWTRPCRGCSAPGPHQCPYAYLLDPEELAEVGRISSRRFPEYEARDEAEESLGHA